MIGTRQRLLLLFQYVDSANFLEFDHSELHWHCHECNSLALIRHKLEIYCKQMHHHCRLMWNRIRRLSQTHPTSPPPSPYFDMAICWIECVESNFLTHMQFRSECSQRRHSGYTLSMARFNIASAFVCALCFVIVLSQLTNRCKIHSLNCINTMHASISISISID